MKNVWIFIFLLLLTSACEKDLPMYSGRACVDFTTDALKDSVMYSFAFFPGKESDEIKIPVHIIGKISDEEREYKYEVDPRSTARAGVDYESLPLAGVIKAGQVTDTIRIHVLKNPDMDVRSFSLFLALIPSDEFVVGLEQYRCAKIYVSNMLTQPQWWDTWYVDNVMGAYSDKKYRYFIKITGIADLGELELYKMRTTVLQFKYHIEELYQQALNETDPEKRKAIMDEITDEDGTKMNIPLRGSLPDRN